MLFMIDERRFPALTVDTDHERKDRGEGRDTDHDDVVVVVLVEL